MWKRIIHGVPYMQERLYDPLTGKARTVSVRITPDSPKGRKEARTRLLERLSDNAPKTSYHLSDLIDLYKKELEKTVRYSTYMRNSCSLNTVLSIIGDVYIDRLTAGYVRQKLIETGKSNTAINELIKRFKTFLMWAYRCDYLPDRSVPDKLIKLPDKTKKDRIADKYLEKKELQALIKAMDLERWRLLTEFLALSGLRIGEAVGLNNDDVGQEYISVTKSFSGSYHILGDPKTRSSIRDVYIQPELAEVIRKVRVCMMRQRMQFGYDDRGYFFAGIDGDRAGYAGYSKYLREIASKVVPDKQVTPHTLRHTMTSLFAEAGVPLEVISRRLGHDSSQLTRDIYLHITKERKIKDNAEVKSVVLLA